MDRSTPGGVAVPGLFWQGRLDQVSRTVEVDLPQGSASEKKERLRQEMRSRLAALTPSAARAGAERLADRVMTGPEIQGREGIFICLSFGVEIDTWGLVDRLLASGRRVYVPRAVSKTRRLHVHPYPCPLRRLTFGLSQPRSEAPEISPEDVSSRIDLALISGLAFDSRGYRLGYGGGFFDRFLANRSFRCFGLAYELQQIEGLPVEAHDIPMDSVLYG